MQEEATELKHLLEAIQEENTVRFLELAESLHYADLADIYEDLNPRERSFFAGSLSPERFAKIITELPASIVEESLYKFDTADQREILDQVSDDDRVDLLQDVSVAARRKLLDLVEPDDIDVTRSLLRYSEDTAGGRMTTAYGRVSLGMAVKEALDTLREYYADSETLSRVFVIDDKDRLIGRMRFRDLAFNSWDTLIDEIYHPCEHSILASADQEEAAQMFSKYDLIVLPVIDEQNRLLGIITHDDALEIIEQESTEDIEKMAGMAGESSEDTYLNTSISTHIKRRFPWLIGLALLSISSGYVMMHFEHILTHFFMLALFLPMVVASGGNTGGQASMMVIRAMALGELENYSVLKVAWKEFRLGLFLGSMIGGCIALFTVTLLPLFIDGELPAGISYTQFSIAVAIALTAQILTSTMVGALLPIGARKLNIDPAVVAAPAITTIVDISGMIIYFLTAQIFLL